MLNFQVVRCLVAGQFTIVIVFRSAQVAKSPIAQQLSALQSR